MNSRNAVSILALAAVFFFALPATVATSRQLSDEAVQVLSLSDTGHERANAVTYSPDGTRLVVGTSSGVVIFDSATYTQERFIETSAWVRSLAYSSDGQYLAGGLLDGTARIWRDSEGEQLRNFKVSQDWVRNVALSPDGFLLATASDDHALRLWDVNSGLIDLTVESLNGMRVLALSPDGQILAVGLQNGDIQLRQVSDGSLMRTLSGHTAWVRSLAFSPDGQTLASGAFDARALLWDVESGHLLHTLNGHQSSVLGVAFSPDGVVLATGSVDRTVRLWAVPTGKLERVLVGHEGFVYSVAFSPDGKTLASGSEDNTVRLWDINTVPFTPADVPVTPSDCRACHHPLSNTSPPAVIEVRCDACHINGIGLNWCPYFTRSPGESQVPDALPVLDKTAGVPVPDGPFGVSIFSPANGETLYSHFDYVAPFTVTGRVAGSESMQAVDVQLEIWSKSTLVSSLHEQPDASGNFDFLLGANPVGNMLLINDPAAPFNCAACHDDFNVQAYLPSGEFRIVVTAIREDGSLAVDERFIVIDVSQSTTLDVSVEDSVSGTPINGLTIQALTRLYDWRGRVASAGSNENGSAKLRVEILSQALTDYKIFIHPQVVDGIYYSMQEPENIVLGPEQKNGLQVTLLVHAQLGRINGKVSWEDGVPSRPVTIWAFQLPVGPIFRTDTSIDGSFSFADIPVSEYLVYPDPEKTGAYPSLEYQQSIDLTKSPVGTIHFNLATFEGLVFNGSVTGNEGEWLPFAWLISAEGIMSEVDVKSGDWNIEDSSAPGQKWTVSAPGYYSQEIQAPYENQVLSETVLLESRAETNIIPWGEGEIVIPGETKAVAGRYQIEFESGWIWGNGSDAQPLVIDTPEMEIVMQGGQFALQGLPDDISWFFLFDGQADLRSKKTGESRTIQPGNMVALSKNDQFVTIPYGFSERMALRTSGHSSLSPNWKPGTIQRIQNILGQAGIGTAQLVTFITYIIAILSLGIVPLITLLWWMKHRKGYGVKHE